MPTREVWRGYRLAYRNRAIKGQGGGCVLRTSVEAPAMASIYAHGRADGFADVNGWMHMLDALKLWISGADGWMDALKLTDALALMDGWTP